MLTPWEIIRFLTGDFRLSKIEASDLIWGAAWPHFLETQNRSVAQVLLDLKSPDRVLMISESVSIVHALPTNIFVQTRTAGVDFTKSTEARKILFCITNFYSLNEFFEPNWSFQSQNIIFRSDTWTVVEEVVYSLGCIYLRRTSLKWKDLSALRRWITYIVILICEIL